MPWFSARVSHGGGGGGGGAASSNWSYITEEMKNGPRGHEVMYRTMDAKTKYKLTTRDIECIEGKAWRNIQSSCKDAKPLNPLRHEPCTAPVIGCQLTQREASSNF